MTSEGLASRAEVILDPRLADIWQLVWSAAEGYAEDPPLSEDLVGGLLRLAYLQGFADAKDEPVEGELYRELGIRAVTASRPAGRARPGAARRRHRNSGR